jgi:hypothetical protein
MWLDKGAIPMKLSPLEYLVIGLKDSQFIGEILPELVAITEKGQVRLVDLLFLNKDEEGLLTINEINAEELGLNDGVTENLMGLLAETDINQLAANMPGSSSAVVLVFEHSWVQGLSESIRRAGGIVITGGMVTPAELNQLNDELAGKEQQYA